MAPTTGTGYLMIQYFINLLVYFFYLHVPVPYPAQTYKNLASLFVQFLLKRKPVILYIPVLFRLWCNLSLFSALCVTAFVMWQWESHVSHWDLTKVHGSPHSFSMFCSSCCFAPPGKMYIWKIRSKCGTVAISSTFKKVSKYFSCPFADNNSWLSGWSADSEIPSSFND